VANCPDSSVGPLASSSLTAISQEHTIPIRVAERDRQFMPDFALPIPYRLLQIPSPALICEACYVMTDSLGTNDSGPSTPTGRRVPDWAIPDHRLRGPVHGGAGRVHRQRRTASIGRDLHYSPTGLQWVVNAYVLTFAGFLLLGGRAADLFGAAGSTCSGGAIHRGQPGRRFGQNSAWLTTARACREIGGAFLSPATLTIIVTTFSERAWPRHSVPGALWPGQAALPVRSLVAY